MRVVLVKFNKYSKIYEYLLAESSPSPAKGTVLKVPSGCWQGKLSYQQIQVEGVRQVDTLPRNITKSITIENIQTGMVSISAVCHKPVTVFPTPTPSSSSFTQVVKPAAPVVVQVAVIQHSWYDDWEDRTEVHRQYGKICRTHKESDLFK